MIVIKSGKRNNPLYTHFSNNNNLITARSSAITGHIGLDDAFCIFLTLRCTFSICLVFSYPTWSTWKGKEGRRGGNPGERAHAEEDQRPLPHRALCVLVKNLRSNTCPHKQCFQSLTDAAIIAKCNSETMIILCFFTIS